MKKACRIISIQIIGFRKHTYFYDRVLSRTVIARSEATRQSVSKTSQFSNYY